MRPARLVKPRAGEPGTGGRVHSYQAYGLALRSELRLPELLRGDGEADFTVRLEALETPPPGELANGRVARVSDGGIYLHYENIGSFLVRNGRDVCVHPAPGVDERIIRLLLLGPVLGYLLHQRGRLVLHASAVAVGDGAVAFVGDAGSGKSTIAAAFHAAGCPVVADDVVAVDLDGDSPSVFPGFPRVKLWPESVVALREDAEGLPRLHPRLEKRGLPVKMPPPDAPLRLSRIYALLPGPTTDITPIPPAEALEELLRHSYGKSLLHDDAPATNFLQCARLLAHVPVRRLTRRQSLAELRQLARVVTADLAAS